MEFECGHCDKLKTRLLELDRVVTAAKILRQELRKTVSDSYEVDDLRLYDQCAVSAVFNWATLKRFRDAVDALE